MAKWSIPIARLAEKAKVDVDTAVRKVTLDLFASVARRSPVDTGRFRANWNVSYRAIDSTVTGSVDQGRLSAEVAKAATLPVGGIVFMTNALPYARALEYGLYPNPPKNPGGKTAGGHSKQAPAGMVRITVREFDNHVAKALA